MKSSSSSDSSRKKKRIPERVEAYRGGKPAVLAPVSAVKPSDLLGRLLLPRAGAAAPQTRAQVYFSSLASPPSSSRGQHDRHGSSTDDSIHGHDGIGNQEADSGPRTSQRRRDGGVAASFLAFQHKYGKKDALIAYALRVLRDGLVVRRADIPRVKNLQEQLVRDQRTPQDALYLVYSPAPPCGFRNVYWLSFIDEQAAVDPQRHQRDYFSLTCRGLTHFEAGTASEFVDIPSWIDEKRAFDHMTTMRGLERIQQMLFFFSWKRKAVKNRHKRVQARLRESFLGCHAVAARVLRQVRAQCLQIEEYTTPVKRANSSSLSLTELRSLQHDYLATARSFLLGRINDIGEFISCEACRPAQPTRRSVSYTPANLSALSHQLETASLRERLFPFLRLAELQLAEAVRSHSIAFVRQICRQVCGDDGTGDSLEDSAKSFSTSFLYAQIVGAVDTDLHAPGLAPLEIRPAKEDVFEALHSVLAQYLTAMDALPRLFMDARFQHVLTPFEPSYRPAFCRSLSTPSSLALEACEVEMTRMKAAVDFCYQRVERVRSEHLRVTLSIKVAESKADYDVIQPLSSSDNLPTNTSSASAHEAALKTWNRFLTYADTAGAQLHVGFLVVDQQQFVDDLRDHVARHLEVMNDLLPREYAALLQSLVDDVDARIDRVTKIPGSLESAMVWIDQVSEMLPTHTQRQLFDAKCYNLKRLKALVKERADRERDRTMTPQHEQLDGSVRKLEVTWESLYETLFLCLERVQDRNGVHRRSLDELTSRTEEYIGDQLQQILTLFADLPTGIGEELQPAKPEVQTDIVSRLEELVEMDMERWQVVKQYAVYEREFRMVSELPSDQWATTLSGGATGSLACQGETLPTEMLLQYIVTAFELRQWFTAWTALRAKWEAVPVVQVHPGAVVDRIKQFRKRLTVSARRMNRLSTALLKTSTILEQGATAVQTSPWGFAAPDHQLVRAFRASIDEMARLSKVFQAVNGGLFDRQHWEQLQGLLHYDADTGEELDRDRFALRQLLKADGDTLPKLMEFFDDCIVESRLHAQLDRSRHRLSRIRVSVCEENYSVRCGGVDEALRELDSILMDVKLCLYQQNPELQDCVATCAEIERLVAVCEFISTFQRQWLPLFDLLKLHDVEEFIVSQQKQSTTSTISAGASSPQSETCGDSNAWKAFTTASQRWADCMRRIFFTRPLRSTVVPQSSTTVTLKGKRTSLNLIDGEPPDTEDTDGKGTSKTRSCSLVEIARGFHDFDFELEVAACERGMALVRGYLSMLRVKSPRLLLVEDVDLLRLLTHDQDVAHLHRILTCCFPHASRFSIKRCSPHFELGGSAPTSDSVRITDDVTTSILVDGLIDSRGSSAAAWTFRMPVTKIGRVKFWLSRIEEEMALMVRGNVQVALQWVLSSSELIPGARTSETEASTTAHGLLLPQSIAAAAVFRFSYEVARRWTRLSSGDTASAIQRLGDLGRQQETTMSELIIIQRAMTAGDGHTTRSLVNTDNLLLLLRFQSESLCHIIQCLRAQREEDARFFWAMQYKVHLCQLSTTSTSVSGSRQAARAESVDLPSDIEAAVHSMKRRDLDAVEMYAQVAHIELAIGHEFTGWSRVPVLSPLSQRCAFALFSAVRALKTPAMVAPYCHRHLGDDTSALSVVTTLSQLLMAPLLQFKCSSVTHSTRSDLERLEGHLDAAVALNAFLLVRNFSVLSQPTKRLLQERLSRRSLCDSTPTNHQASVRFNGGPPLPGPAVIIPFSTHQSLQSSGLLDPVHHQFRPVAVPPVAISFLVESLLLPHGYSRDQVARAGVVEALEALDTTACDFEGKCGIGIRSVIPKVVGEAMRLCTSYRVKTSSILDAQRSSSPQAKLRRSSMAASNGDNTSGEAQERRVEQTAFRVALLGSMELLLACGGYDEAKSRALEQFTALLDALFPFASRSKTALSPKLNDKDDAVASAVELCLEEAGLSSSTNHRDHNQQVERVMEIWKLLQVHDGVIVYGPTGSGKSTSIKALHRALAGLALASNMDGEGDEVVSPGSDTTDMSKLTVVNADVLSLDYLHAEVEKAVKLPDVTQICQQGGEDSTTVKMMPPRWIVVDGELDSAVLDRVMLLGVCGELNNNDSDERDPAALVTRCLTQSAQAGNSQVSSTRVLFETISLANLSPSTLTQCASIFISATCIMYEAVVSAWKRQWQQRLCVTASTEPIDQEHDESALGSQRLGLLFKTVDVMLADVCLPFIELENTHHEQSKTSQPLHFGGLSLNHMASTALTQLALWCFPRHQSWHSDGSLLPPPTAITELAAFSVLWGFTGHMPHSVQHKLEFFLRAKLKDSLALRHLSDARGSLFDASRFDSWSSDDASSAAVGDPWPMQPPTSSPCGGIATERSQSQSQPPPAPIQSAFDASSGQLVVLQPVALPLVRVCSQLVHNGASFMLVGPAASGKTSLLRWLLHANDEAQAAEMMVDRALDQRQAHGVLDWVAMPTNWFAAPTTASTSSRGDRSRAREENELFPPHSSSSFVFVDDLSVDDKGPTGSAAKLAFLRSILDHRKVFSSQQRTALPVSTHVGAAMRLDGGTATTSRQLPPSVTRLLRHFAVLHTPEYSQRDMLSVFRAKFNAHFDFVSRPSGPGASGRPDGCSSAALTASEVLLRASSDWIHELSMLRDSLRAQGVSSDDSPSTPSVVQALTFNWHHLSVLLARTLAFASELSPSQARDGAANSEPPTVTLVELGRLHQSWLSELQNLFLVNWPPLNATDASTTSSEAPASASISQEDDVISKKLWAIVRLVSEKYFSVALQDERDLPVSVATAYFSLRLTDTHVQAPLLQRTSATELRELLTALASSAPSVGANARSTQRQPAALSSPSSSGTSPLVVNHRQPMAEKIVTMLLELSHNGLDTESTPFARKHQHRGDPSPDDLELRLLLSSPSLLTHTLHVVHALGHSTPQSPLVVLSARHGLAMAHRLASFACSLHGFQVQRVAVEQKQRVPSSAMTRCIDGDTSALLVDVLLAVGARHQRIALWVDWRDLLPAHTGPEVVNSDTTAAPSNPHAVSPLVSLIEEICLGQIPSLVLDQVSSTIGVRLRDAVVMGVIHDKSKMDTATETQLLRDFCSRIKQNLRVCIFDTQPAAATTACSPPATCRARVQALKTWLRTQSSCVWLQLDIKSHQLSRITTSIAQQAAATAAPTPKDPDKSLSSTCLTALHSHIMSFASPLDPKGLIAGAVAPEHSVEYFLSFVVNLLAYWKQVSRRETSVVTRCQSAIDRFKVLSTELLPQVTARLGVLDNHIQDLSELDHCHVGTTSEVVNCQHSETQSTADALAKLDYTSWCRRSELEERRLKRCELDTERQTLAQFMDRCQQSVPQAESSVDKWEEAVDLRQTQQFWRSRLGDAVLQAVNASYSFLWSLPGDYNTVKLRETFVIGIKQILLEYELYPHDATSGDSSDPTALLARLLLSAELPMVLNEDVQQVLRAGFTVAGRLPVFVDSTGIFQRLFVRCFSGQPLLNVASDSAYPRGSPLRARQEDSAAPMTNTGRRPSHNSGSSTPGFIVSCTAPDLQSQLAEAQRLDLPVLLLDFRPEDHVCATLSPFLDAIKRRSHTRTQSTLRSQPLGVLEQLAVQTYYTQAADRASRRTARRTASVYIGSATAIIGPSIRLSSTVISALGAASSTTRGRRSSLDRRVDPGVLHAAVQSHQNIEKRENEAAIGHQRQGKLAFQVIAVSTVDVALSIQHQRCHQIAFYPLEVDKEVLGGEFFPRLWLQYVDQDGESLLRGLGEAKKQLVDCCALVADARDSLWTVIDEGTSFQRAKLTRNGLLQPLASTASTLEYYGRVSDALETILRHERRLEMFRDQYQVKKTAFDGRLGVCKAAGRRVASLGRCLSVLPSLLPAPASGLYSRSYRWLEYRVIEELASLERPTSTTNRLDLTIDDAVRAEMEAQYIVELIATDVEEELISSTHRQLIKFIRAVERATDTWNEYGEGSEQRKELFLWQTLSFLSTTGVVLPSVGVRHPHQESLRQGTDPETGQGVNSLVAKLRSKVRLGAILMDCFSVPSRSSPMPSEVHASPSSSHPLFQDARQRRQPYQGLAMAGSFSALTALDPSQQPASSEVERVLRRLFTVVEEFWVDWKAAKLQRRRQVERLLAAHGIRRARRASLRHLERAAAAAVTSTSTGSSIVSDTTSNSANTVRLKSLHAVLAEFGLFNQGQADGDGDRDSVSTSLARLLLTSCFFPDQLAEVVEAWCDVVMPQTPTSGLHRQAGNTSDLASTELESEQGDLTLSGRHRRLPDFGAPSPALAAIVSDVSPARCRAPGSTKAGKPPVVLLPKCLVVYTPSTDATAQHLTRTYVASVTVSEQVPPILTWYRSSGSQDRNCYHDQLVALATSTMTATVGSKQGRRCFAVDILDPRHFDSVVATVSRVVNEHALLAAPEWIAVCSLNVAMRISSSQLSLLPRVFVDSTNLTQETRATTTRRPTKLESIGSRGFTVADRHAHEVAENLSWLQSGQAARDDSERELLLAAVVRCVSSQVRHQDHEGAQVDVDELEDAVEQEPSRPPLLTSSAALSADLASGIALSRDAIMSIVHEPNLIKEKNASPPPQAACDQVEPRIVALFESLKQTADALEAAVLASASTKPLLFPWWSLQRELETQNAFFRSLDAHLQAHLSPSSHQINAGHSTATTTVSRGSIPLSWIASALKDATKSTRPPSSPPCWPIAHVSVAQLVVLLAYRFALLADWLASPHRRQQTRSVDLAGVYDARGLLLGLKQHFALRSGVSLRHVTLALVKDGGNDGQDGGDSGLQGLGAAFKQQQEVGNDVVIIGMRIEGLVLLEMERSEAGDGAEARAIVAFHSLPPCRLECRIAMGRTGDVETIDRRVPLVVLPSLSPYCSQSTVRSWAGPEVNNERIDWVELELEPSDVGVSLQQQQQQDFDHGDDPKDDDNIKFALGVPLFAADDTISNSS